MDNRKKSAIRLMVILDYFTSVLAWLIFWFYRQKALHQIDPSTFSENASFTTRDYIITFFLLPLSWLFLYYLSGTYFDLYRKSRLHEIYRSLISVLIGSLIIGMVVFANDTSSFSYFLDVTSLYFAIHISLLLIFRLLLLNKVKKDLINKKVGYNTLILGELNKIREVYEEIDNNAVVVGNIMVGYIDINQITQESCKDIPSLGSISELEKIIKKHQIEEVIVALKSSSHKDLESLVMRLSYTSVIVKVLPDLYDIISGFVRIGNVFAPALISINAELLPDWQKVCKRVIDISISAIGIIILSPVYLLAALKVKASSPGPIFYKQPRIGLMGKPFYIFKFRSMYLDSEKKGPLLSSDDDPRITPWGKIMRKWRIDEIPQFFNILSGDMSLVGPRPERQHYIRQIVETHPHYKFLHRVKPGITSWGMVKFGYAENIEQMIQRMKYDLLYIENCSLALDIKIMIYTVKVIFQGRGK